MSPARNQLGLPLRALNSSSPIKLLSSAALFAAAALVGVCSPVAEAQTAQYAGQPAVDITGTTLRAPFGVTVSSSGEAYIGDTGNSRVLQLTPSTGNTSTVYLYNSSTDPGCQQPMYPSVDSSGNVYFTCGDTTQVFKVPLNSGAFGTATQLFSTASNTGGRGTVIDSSNNLWVAELNTNSGQYAYILKCTTGGSCSTYYTFPSGSSLGQSSNVYPVGLAEDSSGNFYITDTANKVVWKLSNTGTASSPVAGTVTNIQSCPVAAGEYSNPGGCYGVTVDANGVVYMGSNGPYVYKLTPNGGGGYNSSTVYTAPGLLHRAVGIALDPTGTILYAADYTDNNQSISNGITGPATASTNFVEFGASGQGFGSVAVGTTASTTLTLTFTSETSGTLSSVAVLTQGIAGLDFADAGTGTCAALVGHSFSTSCTVNVTFTPTRVGLRTGAVELLNSSGAPFAVAYVYGTGTGPLVNYSPFTTVTVDSSISGVEGLVGDANGNLYGATGSHIYKETLSNGTYSQSLVTTGTLSTAQWVTVDAAGDLFIANSSGSTILKETPSSSGYTASTAASFNGPNEVAVDAGGNLYTASGNSNGVYKFTLQSNGTYVQSQIASNTNNPWGVAVDPAGNVFYVAANTGYLYRLTPASTGSNAYVQTTLDTTLSNPTGIAIDSSGNVYVANDATSGPISKYTYNASNSGCSTTLASCYSKSSLTTGVKDPVGIWVDANDNIFIGDTGNNRILKLDFSDAPSLTFSSTSVGSTSSSQTVSIENVGSAALSFPVPSSGTDPSVSTNFSWNSSGGSACPALTTSSSGAGTLAAGSSCNYPISFAPVVSGSLSGSLVLTDTNLNAGSPSYATQSIALSGTATAATGSTSQTITFPQPTTPVAYPASAVTLTATASSNLSVYYTVTGPATVSGSTLSFTGVGTVVVTAYQNGNSTYAAATPVSDTIAVTAPSTNVGSTSATLTATLTITTAGTTSATLGTAIQVLTQGATGLDFAYVSGGTCAVSTAYTVGQTCTVEFTFTPSKPGVRMGAIELFTASGTAPIAVAYISGIGDGPLVTITPGTLSTFAGTGTQGDTGNGSAATAAELNNPAGVALDGAGNLYFAESGDHTVRKVTKATGFISTVAGTGSGGTGGDGGAATSAGLYNPTGVAVDGAGNLYIADQYNSRIQKVTAATGIVTTVAGTTNNFGYSGDGGSATSALLWLPAGVAVDAAGNLYIADQQNQRIRKVTAATGIITTVAGNGTGGYSGDGAAATGAELYNPNAVTVDAAGNLYIADYSNNRIRKVSAANGYISTVAGNGTGGFSGDGGVATSAELNIPTAVAVDAAGDLYIADWGNNRIREVTAATGYISTVTGSGTTGCTQSTATCGDGGSATATGAYLKAPSGVALDGAGNLYIGDSTDNRIRKVTAAANPVTFATATAAGSTDTTDGAYTLTLNNIGNTSLSFPTPGTGTNPSIAANFTIGGSSTCPQITSTNSAGSLASGASCTDLISFAPAAVGSINGSMVTTDNSLNLSGATQTISLSGTGTQAAQTITFTNPGTQTYGTSPTLTASATSGLSVAFTSATTGVCTITSGGALTTVAPGTCTIDANQAGNSNYSAATQVAQSFNIAAAAPTVTGISPATGTPAGGTSVTITGSNGGATVTAVYFGAIAASSFSVVNSTTITATSPSGSVGSVDVTLVNTAGTSSTSSADLFSYMLTEPVGTSSGTLTATVTITTAGQPSTISVLTQGASGLDFQVASGGTCSTGTTYSLNQTCTVNYTFTPTHPGLRYGGVTLTTSAGAIVGNTLLLGVGNGPQIVWQSASGTTPAITTTAASGLDGPYDVVGDGAGNLYEADLNSGSIIKVPYSGGAYGTPVTAASGFANPCGLAMDGLGNIFVADYGAGMVKEILAVNGVIPSSPTIRTLGSGFSGPCGVAVDLNGDVFVTDLGNSEVKMIAAVNGVIPASSPTIRVLGSGFNQPWGVAVDPSGDVFVADAGTNTLTELLAVGGYVPSSNPASTTIGSGFAQPMGLRFDGMGNLFVVDNGNHKVKELLASNGSIPASPTINTIAQGLNNPAGLWIDASGDVFIAVVNNNAISELAYSVVPAFSFSSTNVGSSSSQQVVTLANNGNTSLTLSALNASSNANFSGSGTSCTASTVLTENSTCALGIVFAPTAAGNPLNTSVGLTDNNLNVSGATQTIAISGTATQVAQTISFNNPGTQNFGTSPTLTASSTSALSVAFTSATTGVCTITSGGLLTTVAAGTCTIDANQAGNSEYSAAPQVAQSFTIAAIAPTVSGISPATGTAAGGTSVTITGSNGGAAVTAVYFGTIAASSFSVVNATTITATSPSASAGSVPVTLVNTAGTSSTSSADLFTYTLSEPVGSTSGTLTATVQITSAGQPAGINVLTQGSFGWDFQYVSGGTCSTSSSYTVGQSCTVQYTFAPLHPWTRYGAVVLTSSSGAVLGTTYITGVGIGPQATFPGNGSSTALLSGTSTFTAAIAMDDAENGYYGNAATGSVYKIAYSFGSYNSPSLVASGFSDPNGVAVDGAGNVFVADTNNHLIQKVPLSGASYRTPITLASGSIEPWGIAVDGSGNIFFADQNHSNPSIKELPYSNGSYGAAVTLASGLLYPTGVAVDGSGNVYFVDENSPSVNEIPFSNGSYGSVIVLESSNAYGPLGLTVDGGRNVFFTDTLNDAVVEIPYSSGSYGSPRTMASGFTYPYGVAIDGGGNLFVTDPGTGKFEKLDYTDPPSLTFASTADSTSSAALSVTLTNDGNASLIPAGLSVSSSFTEVAGSGNPPDCVTSASVSSGSSCNISLEFMPGSSASGSVTGTAVETDNSLNSTGATQTIQLTGTAVLNPTVTSISPSAGVTTGGTTVTINGANLTGATAVNFGSSAATNVTVVNSSQITATSPSGSGTVDVTVTTGGGTSATTSADRFTYGTLPVVTGLSVSGGQAAGGTVVTIKGTGFTNVTAVTFGTTAATTYTVNSSTSITATSPAGTQGTVVDVTVATVVATSSTSAADLFTYQPIDAVGTQSGTLTATVTISSAGQPSTISVLTQGASGLDFQVAAGGTCSTSNSYTVGQTCTVNYTFTPAYPGLRLGGVVLMSSGGQLLGSARISGIGTGPLVTFPSNTTTTTLASGFSSPTGVVVDGRGDVFVDDQMHNAVKEIVAGTGGNPPGVVSSSSTVNSIVTSGISSPRSLAVDGAGNVFFADLDHALVKEIVAGTGGNAAGMVSSTSTVISIGSGFSYPCGVAVDGSGNVFVADYYSTTAFEILAGTGGNPPGVVSSSSTVVAIGSGLAPQGIAVDGSGDVFLADTGNNATKEIVAGTGGNGVGQVSSASTVISLGPNGSFILPTQVAVDSAGDVFVSDYGHNAMKEIVAGTGGNGVGQVSSASTVLTLGSGFGHTYGVALDGSGDVFAVDEGNGAVKEIPLSAAPALSFASTNVGSTSSDSPRTVTVANSGNASLSLPVPGTGNNPSISTNFSLSSTGASACPVVASTAGSAGALTAGEQCALSVSFVPTGSGSLSGSLVLTDNSLNVSSATQTISLSGTGVAVPTVSSVSPNGGPLAGNTGVTITGSDLSGVTAVTFGTTAATNVTVVNPTTVTATAPAESAATVDVTVTAGGVTSAASSADHYTYYAAPTVTSLSSSSGTAEGGENITITGTSFTGATAVTFGGIAATSFTVNSATSITATVPAGTVGQALVTVTTPGGVSSQSVYFTYTLSQALGTQSTTLTVTVLITTAGQPASINVVTQGVAGLDFVAATGGTCSTATTYSLNATCTVNYTFAPTAPGVRLGGVTLVNSSGTILGTAYISGTGTGPALTFAPFTQTTLTGPFSHPEGITGDASGNLFVSDSGTQHIYKETFSNGTYTQSTITTSSLNSNQWVTLDGLGNLYIADGAHNRVVKEAPNGSGYTETVPVSSLSGGNEIAVDGVGNLYVASGFESGIVKETLQSNGTYTQSLIANSSNNPWGVVVDSSGNIYYTNQGNGTLYKLTPSGGSYNSTQLVSGLHSPQGLAVDSNGNLYICEQSPSNDLIKETLVSGTTYTQSVQLTGLNNPNGIWLDPRGNAFVGDTGNSRVLKLDHADAPSYTFPSSTTAGATDTIDGPFAVTITNFGNAAFVTSALTIGSGFTQVVGSGSPADCTSTGALAAQASCNLSIEFAPLSSQNGAVSASAMLTDNNLNAVGATQTITLNGIVNVVPTATTVVASTQVDQNVAATAFIPVTGSGGTSPLSYSVASALPAGLSLSSSTGTVSGTATVASSAHSYTVTVTDADGVTATANFSLTVNPALTAAAAVPTTLLTQNLAATSFIPVTGSGGASPLSYGVSPALPAGLSFSSSSGTVSGTPTTVSSAHSYTVTVTDAIGTTATANFSIAVNSAVVSTVAVPTTVLTQNVAANAFTPVTGSGGTSPLSYSLQPALPAGLSLSSSTGTVSGAATAVSPANSYTVTVTDANGATATASFSLTVNSAVVAAAAVPTTILTQNQPATAFIPVTASGGTSPLNYVVAPALPVGLSVSSSTGSVSGTPTGASPAHSYTVTVTDANGATATANFSLTVNPALTATAAVPTTLLTQNQAATAFTPVTGSGGASPLSYGVSPALPAGLSLSSSTGSVSGTATAVSSAHSYTVTVTDVNGATATANFSLTVDSALTATVTVPTAVLTQNVAANAFIPVTGSGGTSPLSYSVAPALPAGLSLSSSTGSVSGTATAATSAHSYTVTVNDANGATATANFSLTVDSTLVAKASVPSATFTQDATANAFTPVTGSGGTSPLSYSVAPALPTGLSLSSSTGTVSGTATTASSAHSYTVTVTDANGATATANFSLTVISPTVTVAPATLPNAQFGTAYSQGLTATGGTAPYTYQVVSGALPAGLTLSGGGVLSGIPIVSGSFSFAVRGTDSSTGAGPYSGTAAYTLVVTATVSNLSFPASVSSGTYIYGEAPVPLTATSASAGAITYAVVSGPAAVNANTGVTTFTGAGTVLLSASQAASTSYPASTTQATLTVGKQASSIAVSASSASVTPLQTVTLTAAVTPATLGTPTGSVTFFDNGAQLGTPIALAGGIAQYPDSNMAPGQHVITATYSGDNNFLATTGGTTGGAGSNSTTVGVAPLSFTLTATGAASVTAQPGAAIQYPLQVTPTYGVYPGTVTFAVSGLPGGATYSVSPASIASNAGAQQVIFTIQLASATAGNSYPSPVLPGRAGDYAPLALGLLLPLVGRRKMRRLSRKLGQTIWTVILFAGVLATLSLTGCGTEKGYFNEPPQSYAVTFTATSGSEVQTTFTTLVVQ